MTIQFRPLDNTPPEEAPEAGSADPAPWLPPTGQAQTEEALFSFLQGLLANRYRAQRPLLLLPDTLRAFYQSPHPLLLEALRHNLDALLVTLHPDVGCWPPLDLTPHVLGVLLAAHNCFLPHLADPVIAFTRALLQTIPPARTPADALAYHAILNQPAAALADWPADAVRAHLLQALLTRSPLTALYHLHLHTPPPLTRLAADMLRWWRRRVLDPAPWRDLADWLTAVAPLLADPRLAVYLRQRWLSLPPERIIGRNLGLLLAALRPQEEQRDFILTFYNAYAYTARTTITSEWGDSYDHWPELAQIERLLRAGDAYGAAAIELNRCGSEQFLKFWSLVQLVAARGLPAAADYRYISSQGLTKSLIPLLDFAVISDASSGLRAGSLEFVSEEPS